MSSKDVSVSEYLPFVYQSPTNKSLAFNLFDRFLSSPNLEYVSGYVGKKNEFVATPRKLAESSDERYGHQLQPVMYEKIGNIEYIKDWKDIQAIVNALGVDSDYDSWLEVDRFNWAPPIMLDKFVNYSDYYWTGDSTTVPQYVVMQNRCTQKSAKVFHYQSLLENYGGEHQLLKVLNRENAFLVENDKTSLFKPGQTFFVRDTGNTEIDGNYYDVVSSEYDENFNRTTINVDADLTTSDIPNKDAAIISMFEILELYEEERDNQCGDSVGWGRSLFDDNQEEQDLQTWAQDFARAVSSRSNPPVGSMPGDLWYDTATDELKLIEEGEFGNEYRVLYENFGQYLDKASGTNSFDLTIKELYEVSNPWKEDNLWKHRSEITDFTFVRQAKRPIIEYNDGLCLSQWTETIHKFCYRAFNGGEFRESDTVPELIELIPLYVFDIFDQADCPDLPEDEQTFKSVLTLESDYGNRLDEFRKGKQFVVVIEDTEIPVTVEDSLAVIEESSGHRRYYTRIKLQSAITGVTRGEIAPKTIYIKPLVTSYGDDWLGYHVHWLYKGVERVIPSDTKRINSYTDVNDRLLKEGEGGFGGFGGISDTAAPEPSEQGDVITATEGQTDFVSPLYNSQTDSVEFYLNGLKLVRDFDYTTPGKDLVQLVEPAHEGDIVNIVIKRFSSIREEVISVPIPATAVPVRRYNTERDFTEVFVNGLRFVKNTPGNTDGDYTMSNGNSVQFNEPLTPLDVVQVIIDQNNLLEDTIPTTHEYSYTSDGTPVFQIPDEFLATNYIEVFVNGIRIIRDIDWTVSSTNTVSIPSIRVNDRVQIVKEVTQRAIVDSGIDPNSTASYRHRVTFNAQEFLILRTGVNVITFDEFLYKPLLGTNDIRVYVNGNFLYGTYQEIYEVASRQLPDGTIEYYQTGRVGKIILDEPLQEGDFLVVETGAANLVDFGLENVGVRVDERQEDFELNGPQPASLIKYRFSPQIKSTNNQYPLFNLFGKYGEELVKRSSIFYYKTDQSQPVDSFLGQRIVPSEKDDSYMFVNDLVLPDQSVLVYKDCAVFDEGDHFWYNTLNDTIYYWYGDHWSKYLVYGEVITMIPLLDYEPKDLDFLRIGTVWYDTREKTLKRYNGYKWIDITELMIVSKSDPTAKTVWEGGDFGDPKTTTVQRVDRDLNPDPNGFWDIPEPWYYNINHDNKSEISFVEVSPHFTNIIDNSEVPTGFVGEPKTFFYFDTDPNLNVGGFMRDHNGLFDTFLSTVTSPLANPLELIEFANLQYENNVKTFLDYYRSRLVELYTVSSSILDSVTRTKTILDTLSDFENDERLKKILDDTPAWENNLGLRNVIATLPILGVSPAYEPAMFIDDDIGLRLFQHHDGHTTNVDGIRKDVNIVIERAIETLDPRFEVSRGPGLFFNTLGLNRTENPVTTVSEYVSLYRLLQPIRGKMWYNRNTEVLYCFCPDKVDDIQPEGTHVGQSWVDSSRNMTWFFDGTNWINNMDSLVWTDSNTGIEYNVWQEIDVVKDIFDGLLIFETKLYERALQTNNKFDLIQFQKDNEDNPKFTKALRQTFDQFVTTRRITQPFANLQFEDKDPFTWNYKYCTNSITESMPQELGGVWLDIYNKYYNTPFPHLNPWRMQGFLNKPDWWNSVYDAPATSSRTWKSDMWNNILKGVIPEGRADSVGTLSDGSAGFVQDYPVVPVNFDDFTVVDSYGMEYAPDALYPPYAQLRPVVITDRMNPENRTIFHLEEDIVNIKTPFLFNDKGFTEIAWNGTSDYLYSILAAFFKLNPIQYTETMMGIDFIEYSGFKVDEQFNRPFTHRNIEFHGELDAYNNVIKVNGLPHWYVTFNRFYEYDHEASDFNALWKDWDTKLSYAFGSFIDVTSLDVGNRNFSLSENDYFVTVKKSPGVRSNTFNGLNADIEYIPGARSTADLQERWIVSLSSFSPIGEPIKYYDVDKFDFWYDGNYYYFDVISNAVFEYKDDIEPDWITGTEVLAYNANDDSSPEEIGNRKKYYIVTREGKQFSLAESRADAFAGNIITLDDATVQQAQSFNRWFRLQSPEILVNAYSIVDAYIALNTFTIPTDKTKKFEPGTLFRVIKSTNNNGVYTVKNAVYDLDAHETIIYTVESVPDPQDNGVIQLLDIDFTIETGDRVELDTSFRLPKPLNGVTPYYVTKLSDYSFTLSETDNEAALGINIVLVDSGGGSHSVGVVERTFNILDQRVTNTVWRKYRTNRDKPLSLNTPSSITGLQNILDVIFTYSEYLEDLGIYANKDNEVVDAITGRVVNWQLEVERFVEKTFLLSVNSRGNNDNDYMAEFDGIDTFKFGNFTPSWQTGRKVQISTKQPLPAPYSRAAAYYIIRLSPTEFKLATSYIRSIKGIAIEATIPGLNVIDTIGFKDFFEDRTIDSHEINPFREKVTVEHETGLLSNVIKGPNLNVEALLTIYDQYNRRFDPAYVHTHRYDEYSEIRVANGIENDVIFQPYNKPTVASYPYDFIHLAGGKLYYDEFEHILVFNGNSVDSNAVIYSSCLGLNIPKVEMEFLKSTDSKQRPNADGEYLYDNKLYPNIEGSIEQHRYAHDLYKPLQISDFVKGSYSNLGYDGPFNFLDFINISDRAQFLFWRGMIQYKGSNRSVQAYINSRRFIGAKLDEFWALKVGEYGEKREYKFPKLRLFKEDNDLDHLQLEFQESYEGVTPEFQRVGKFDNYRLANRGEINRLFEDKPFNLRSEITSYNIIDTASTQFNDPLDIEGADYTKLFRNSLGSETIYLYYSDVIFDTVIIGYYHQTDYHFVLLEENVDYIIVNSRMVQFLTDPTTLPELSVFTINPNVDVHNNIMILDSVNSIITQHLQIWDPARGYHDFNGMIGTDIISDTDPAVYQFDPNTITNGAVWGADHIGEIWMDTGNAVYLPYYDPRVYPKFDDRVDKWGELANGRGVDFYIWTESLEPPDETESKTKEYYRTRPSSNILAVPVTGGEALIQFMNVNPQVTVDTKLDLPSRFINTFVVSTAAQDEFLLPQNYIVGEGLVSVTVNGSPVQFDETSSDVITLDVAAVEGQIVTIESQAKTFTTNFVIDGDSHVISREFDRDETYGQLLNEIKILLRGKATVTMNEDGILIESITKGPDGSVRIVETATTGIFSHLARVTQHTNYRNVQNDGSSSYIQVLDSSVTFESGTPVYFYNSEGAYPVGIFESVQYFVNHVAGNTYIVLDVDGDIVNIESTGQGITTIAPAQFSEWVENDRAEAVYHASLFNTLPFISKTLDLPVINNAMQTGDYVNVYVNEELVRINVEVAFDTTTNSNRIKSDNVFITPTDFIRIVKEPISEENTDGFSEDFDPELEDIGQFHIQVKSYNQFSVREVIENGVTNEIYYYWVANTRERFELEENQEKLISLFEKKQLCETRDKRFCIITKPEIREGSNPSSRMLELSEHYDYEQLTIVNNRGLSPIDNVYQIMIPYNFSIRNEFRDLAAMKKNVHNEWKLFRQEQTSTVDKYMWNRLIEAMIGYKLEDPTTPVPSLDYQIYDDVNNTTTRYGFKPGQVLIDGEMGKNTVLDYLLNDTNDFSPVNIKEFLIEHNFETPEGTKDLMCAIYNTFTREHVNAIFFELLHDAQTVCDRLFEDIFKTSFIAVHGVKLFDTPELFDD